MQTSEMINETPDFIPTTETIVEKKEEQSKSIEVTPELAVFISKTVDEAIKQFVDRLVTPPVKIPVPIDDKIPGVDTITLSPEEWKYFVEELKTKNLYSAVNNAKYIVELKRRFDEMHPVAKNMEENADA